MPASPFDSDIYRQLLHDDEAGRLFSDEAEIQAMLQVEAALAKTQGRLGLIPAASAQAIEQALAEMRIEPPSLAPATARAGVPVPALLEALRESMQAPEHAQYLHWGATSQDIMDSGLILRLRRVCELVAQRLTGVLRVLAQHAEKHAELPLLARTRTQGATPTSFGAIVAAWGLPLCNHLEALAQLEPRLLRISLAGAAGNATALGEKAAELRSLMAAELGLADTGFAWHSERSALAEFCALLTRIGASLAKMATDYLLAAQPEVGELRIAAGGNSSTMPQKNNPVAAEILVGLSRLSLAMNTLMTEAMLHRQQRDGAAWSLESHALPQVSIATAKGLAIALQLATDLDPDPAAMRVNLAADHGRVYAEAIGFKLAETLPRPEAQALVKQLCAEAVAQNCDLAVLMARRFPDTDWVAIATPAAQLGDAPLQARAFAERVRML